MDIFRAFLSAISSQWREPTKSVEELKSLSIFAFAQEVCSRLQHEIEMLPKEHSKSAPRGIFRGNLVGFQAKLMAHGEALNDDDAKRTRTALNMLEHLCRVSYHTFNITFTMAPSFAYAFYSGSPFLAEFEGSKAINFNQLKDSLRFNSARTMGGSIDPIAWTKPGDRGRDLTPAG